MSQQQKNINFENQATTAAPIAVILPEEQQAVLLVDDQQQPVGGSIVRMDGTGSIDPLGNPLTFSWSFIQIPIGSQVDITGFTELEADGSVVSFAPDVTGHYQVQLVVNNGAVDSEPAVGTVEIKQLLVPHNQGYVPSASFIWDYLSDFWPRVEDRERLETFWSAAIQLVSAELLKLYQIDYNKSIKDIQENFQRRWVSYPIELLLDRTKVSFLIQKDQAGLNASTILIDPVMGAPLPTQPDFIDRVAVPLSEGNFARSSSGSAILPGAILRLVDQGYALLRAGQFTRADVVGNAVTTAATNIVIGSGFLVGQVGEILRLGPPGRPDAGDYRISVFTNDHTVHVTTLSGDPVSFAGSLGLSFAVFPIAPTTSIFVADRVTPPGHLSGKPWRLSASLKSTEWDFEAQGARPGDLVEIEVTRSDSNSLATFRAQVTAVDRNRLGYVLTSDALVDGIAANGLSIEDQQLLAISLRVPGLTLQSDGTLAYSDLAEAIHNRLTSDAFFQAYSVAPLTPTDPINVGPFSIFVRPVRVLRLSRIPTDITTVSVPALQEYIKQPTLTSKDGQLYQISEDRLFPMARQPYLFLENLDYVVDNERTFRGTCDVVAGSPLLHIQNGDVVQRGVVPGDQLVVTIGSSSETMTIRQVLSPDQVEISPTPTLSGTDRPFQMKRKTGGVFVRLLPGRFDKKLSIPARLWAEVAFFDNSQAVEDNFGVLVGLPKSRLDEQNARIPYKSAVQGLMFALTQGPDLQNLRLAAQILLGLPFAKQAGVITEINPLYRVRADGSPLLGRILIAGSGRTDLYFYPQGRQIEDPINSTWVPANPDLSGIADNPATGLPYAVGDSVTQFAALAKGLRVSDYLSDPTWFETAMQQGDPSALLSQFHAFRLLVNADIVGAADIDLASEFLRIAKPAYVKFVTGFEKLVEDDLPILDDTALFRPFLFSDIPSQGLPTALRFDYPTSGPEDHVSLAGQNYALYHTGTDLILTPLSTTATSDAGGFVTERALERHDTPFIAAGDLLVIYVGANKGQYLIGSVSDDTTLLALTDLDGNAISPTDWGGDYDNTRTYYTGDRVRRIISGSPQYFQAKKTTPGSLNYPESDPTHWISVAEGQSFAIFRAVKNPIFKGFGALVQGNPVVQIAAPGGIFSAGVASGDELVFTDAADGTYVSRIYVVKSIDVALQQITLTSPPVEASSASKKVTVARPGIFSRFLMERGPLSIPFNTIFNTGSSEVVFDYQLNRFAEIGFIRPGYQIVVPGQNGAVFEVLDWDPSIRTAYVTPPSAFGNGADVDFTQIVVPGRGLTPMNWSLLDRLPDEYVQLTLLSQDGNLITTMGTPDVSTGAPIQDFNDLGVLPGDMLVIVDGPDSLIDIGYGAGVFPILKLVDPNTIRLTRTLTNTTAVAHYGLQRRKRL